MAGSSGDGRHLSQAPGHDGRHMKALMVLMPGTAARETMARFGRANLVRLWDGRFVVEGGGDHEVREAREWAAHFLHEAVFIGRIPGRRS